MFNAFNSLMLWDKIAFGIVALLVLGLLGSIFYNVAVRHPVQIYQSLPLEEVTPHE